MYVFYHIHVYMLLFVYNYIISQADFACIYYRKIFFYLLLHLRMYDLLRLSLSILQFTAS